MTQPTSGIGNVIDNSTLLQMAMAYSRSRVLCAAARLGIADALADDTRDLAFLAGRCQADPDALYRLLRTLAAIGVTQETTPEHFRLTPFGQPLRRDHPASIWPSVVFWADLLADSWSLLTDCVRTGKKAAEIRDPAIPSRWSQDPDAGAIFRAVMGTAPSQDYAPIAQAWDFSHASVVADLGGGGGSLLLAVLQQNPHLQGMLVDHPASIEAAQPRFADLSLASRCRLIAADLTQSVPPGADVCMLKHVLHGYTDASAAPILRNVRAALPPNGRLLVIEFVLPAVVSQADPNLEGRLLSDLNMLAVTGGRERSERQWHTLLEANGFTLTQVHPLAGDPHMVRNVAILEAQPTTLLMW